MDNKNNSVSTYKVVMVGDSNSDKINLAKTAAFGYNDEFKPSIAAAYHLIKVSTPNGDVELQCWDSPSNEKYFSLSSTYLRDADAVVLCFDTSNSNGFGKVPDFFKMIKDNEDAKIFLVGTKNELGKKIPIKSAKKFAKENGLPLSFVSTQYYGIQPLFSKIATQLQSPDTKVSFDDDFPIKISTLFRLIYDNCSEIEKLENNHINSNDKQVTYSLSKHKYLLNKLSYIRKLIISYKE